MNEMFKLVKANIDKTVKVTYRDGKTDLALVLTVDDEGFVYDLASSPTGEGDFWTPFSEIEIIETVGPSWDFSVNRTLACSAVAKDATMDSAEMGVGEGPEKMPERKSK